jgi:UDP-N-acetyl-alpha-D-quinovosamine dehydrogenase
MILVSGAGGFIGRALVNHFSAIEDSKIRASSRRSGVAFPSVVEQFMSGDISGSTDWQDALQGVDVVIHTAARVHVMADTAVDPLAEYRRVNTEGTLNLARQAAACGVRRFVFISSIKVNGEETAIDSAFTEQDIPAPIDKYGISKYEAEEGLRELAAKTGIEIVIIRPVLVYGPGVKGNFYSMMKWLSLGVPLPFGAIFNRRSLISIENLVDLIVTCVEHPSAANQTFLASDGEDLSTTELLRLLGSGVGKPARLIPVPSGWLNCGAALLGKQALAKRVCGSLRVDISKARNLLGWEPPVNVDNVLHKTAMAFSELQKT